MALNKLISFDGRLISGRRTRSGQAEGPGGSLNGLCALINGGDAPASRTVALAIAAQGARVAISNTRHVTIAYETARLVAEQGGTCMVIEGTGGDRTSCRRMIEKSVSQLGGLDVLVNCAEIDDKLQPDEVSRIEAYSRSTAFQYLYSMTAALPYMPAGSSVINVTGVAWDQGMEPPDQAAVMSAIQGLTRSFARAVSARGIRVNALRLMPMSCHDGTDLGVRAHPGVRDDERMGETCAFLASRDAAHLTGQVFYLRQRSAAS